MKLNLMINKNSIFKKLSLALALCVSIVSLSSCQDEKNNPPVIPDEIRQTGTGLGKYISDPLFRGNEGVDEPLEIFFIETTYQYADAIYMRKGLVDVLIDAGQRSDGPHIKEFLNSHMKDETLDIVMMSHNHADHYGGIEVALEAVDNVTLFLDFGGYTRTPYTQTRQKFMNKGSRHITAYDCVNDTNNGFKNWYITPEFTMNILNTGHYVEDGIDKGAFNPESVTALFTYKQFTYFTAGDLTTGSELDLMSKEDLPKVSLYKASHHGSNGSNSYQILNKLDPYCVGVPASITGSSPYEQDGLHCHPGDSAMRRIYQAPRIKENKNVYWNGVNGDMCFTTFGGSEDITFKGSETIKGYYYNEIDEAGNSTLVKATGEENLKFHETKLFQLRNYQSYI